LRLIYAGNVGNKNPLRGLYNSLQQGSCIEGILSDTDRGKKKQDILMTGDSG